MPQALRDITSALNTLIPHIMEREKVEGISLALIRDAELVWADAYGVSNTASGEPITTDMIFEGASFSKPAAAYVALKMCEQNILDLDRSMAEYLPEPFIQNDPRLEAITLRMVLSHSSGLSHGGEANIQFTPGEKFSYSASGFDYLQRVMEEVTGNSFEDHMQAHLLKPLDMPRSTFVWDGRSEHPFALGYQEHVPDDKWTSNGSSAAASLHTTPSEFARLLIAMLRPDPDNPAHLSPESVQMMLTPQIDINEHMSWGLGWGLQHIENKASFWHWGHWHGYRNYLVAYPDDKSGLVAMTNSSNGLAICGEIIHEALGGSQPALIWLGAVPSVEVDRPVAEVDPAIYDAYCGTYTIRSGFMNGVNIVIHREDDRLLVQTGDAPLELFPTSETQFFDKKAGGDVTFHKDGDGVVTHFTLVLQGVEMQGERLTDLSDVEVDT